MTPAGSPLDAARVARWSRGALSVFIVWHALSGVGSVLKRHPVGAAIRAVTRPYEQILGVYQSWPMFAPNAPSERAWVEAEASLQDGGTRPLDPLVGERADAGFSWFYLRAGKYDRNLPDPNNRFLRRAYAHWLCRQASAAGLAPARISLVAASRPTPDPATRLRQPDAREPVAREALDAFKCPRR